MSRARARDEPVRPQCPVCASKFVRYRVRTEDYTCRRCGATFFSAGEKMYAFNAEGDRIKLKRSKG